MFLYTYIAPELHIVLLCCNVAGEVPSFQGELEEMKELLQAHRVNLATSQNLRFARTTLYSTILLPPHSHLLAGTQSTLFQYWSSEPTACFGVFRVVNFIHTHTHRASLVEYQQSLQVSTVRVFTDFTRVICIILSLTLTHSLSLFLSGEHREFGKGTTDTERENLPRCWRRRRG